MIITSNTLRDNYCIERRDLHMLLQLISSQSKHLVTLFSTSYTKKKDKCEMKGKCFKSYYP